MLGSTARKGADGAVTHSEAALYLSYVPVHRQVQGYLVYGPGSRALLGVDNVGLIQAFVLHWRAGSLTAKRGKRVPRSKCMTR